MLYWMGVLINEQVEVVSWSRTPQLDESDYQIVAVVSAYASEERRRLPMPSGLMRW